MIPAWFTAQMARMADLRFPPSSLAMHWEGLRDLPDAVLDAAVTRAIQTRASFPAPAELREDADVAAPRPLWRELETEPLPAPVVLGTLPTGAPVVARSRYVPQCPDCGDSGFAPAGERTVRRCACWQTNPVLLRRREVQRPFVARNSGGA